MARFKTGLPGLGYRSRSSPRRSDAAGIGKANRTTCCSEQAIANWFRADEFAGTGKLACSLIARLVSTLCFHSRHLRVTPLELADMAG